MNRMLGVLLMVLVLYGLLLASDANARTWSNQQNIATRLGFYGILTVGVGVLIVAGGIDLSIGSVVGLGAIYFGLLLNKTFERREIALLSIPLGLYFGAFSFRHLRKRIGRIWMAALLAVLLALGMAGAVAQASSALWRGQRVSPWAAALLVLWLSIQIGLVHGLLVTKLRLQPFLVTLCGLFIYRGLARWASSTTVGLAVDAPPEFLAQIETFRSLMVGDRFGVPQQLIILLIVTILLALLLHGTVHGRYLFAIGANEEAARYAGINTDRYKILAYVICSTLAGLGSILLILDSNSANAVSAGSLLELYAITGAVLGGCSLRGGEGSVPGMFLGAAVLPLLRQLCSFGGITNELEYAVIGFALLLGTIADELLRRRAARRAH
jgi:ribose transport system permease protein